MTSHLDAYTYILVDHKPVQHPNDDEWFRWFMVESNRRVAITTIQGETITDAGSEPINVSISTVFTGVDLAPERGCMFETEVFGASKYDRHTWRCRTWDEAEKQHAEIVQMVEQEKKLFLTNPMQ